MGFAAVRSFDNPIEANIIRARLESEGIFSFITDEFTGIYSNALAFIKLMVREEDVIDTLILLDKEWTTQPYFEYFDVPLQSERICPNCLSANVSSTDFSRFVSFINSIVEVIPFIPRHKKKYYCFNCGFKWGEKNDA